MSEERIPIQVKLITEIRDKDNKQEIVVEEPGDYIQKGDAYVLRFTEHHEQEQSIDNLVTIRPGKVIVRRTGPVRMHQVFEDKKMTENIYHHPYGTFHMQTTTRSIDHKEADDHLNGSLTIQYDLEMNGQEKQRHQLSLQYKEEESRV
ncbi:DUF1934 domain-containing protein [Pontibacillus salicampi]|uniref:DUF1934 domain-containing protein n=1 Tax=Pontibacillus salicampi TaxID=1449801 RepID=A0ABV6LS07_9BACI